MYNVLYQSHCPLNVKYCWPCNMCNGFCYALCYCISATVSKRKITIIQSALSENSNLLLVLMLTFSKPYNALNILFKVFGLDGRI